MEALPNPDSAFGARRTTPERLRPRNIDHWRIVAAARWGRQV